MFSNTTKILCVAIFLLSSSITILAQDLQTRLLDIGMTISDSQNLWIVEDVIVNSPAFLAGVNAHDIISSVNDTEIADIDLEALESDTLKFKILRSGKTRQVSLEMTEPATEFPLQIRNYRVDFSKDDIIFVFDIDKRDFIGNDIVIGIYPKDITTYENISWVEGDEQYKDTYNNLRYKQDVSFESNTTTFQGKMPQSLFNNINAGYFLSLLIRDMDGNLLYEADLVSQRIHNTLQSLGEIDTYNRPYFQLGDIVVQIHRVWQLTQVRDRSAENGSFIIMELEVYNLSDRDISLYRENFQIINEDDKQIPDVDLMGVIRDEYYYPDFAYPGTGGLRGSVDGHPSFDILSNHHRKMMVAYEISGNPEEITFEFSTDDQNSATFDLWLIPVADQAEYTYAIATIDGVSNTSIIEWRIFDDSIERLLDIESVELENCNGVGIRRSSRTFSKSTSLETNFNVGLDLDFDLFIPSPIPIGKLNSMLDFNFNRSSSEMISNEITEEIEVPPGKIANYDFVWYVVSIEGELVLDISGESYTIPFKFDDRLRSEVISKPPTDCN